MSKTFEVKIEGKIYKIPCDPPADVGLPIMYKFIQFGENFGEALKNPEKLIKLALKIVRIVDPSIKEIKPTTSELVNLLNKAGSHFKFGEKPKK